MSPCDYFFPCVPYLPERMFLRPLCLSLMHTPTPPIHARYPVHLVVCVSTSSVKQRNRSKTRTCWIPRGTVGALFPSLSLCVVSPFIKIKHAHTHTHIHVTHAGPRIATSSQRKDTGSSEDTQTHGCGTHTHTHVQLSTCVRVTCKHSFPFTFSLILKCRRCSGC